MELDHINQVQPGISIRKQSLRFMHIPFLIVEQLEHSHISDPEETLNRCRYRPGLGNHGIHNKELRAGPTLYRVDEIAYNLSSVRACSVMHDHFRRYPFAFHICILYRLFLHEVMSLRGVACRERRLLWWRVQHFPHILHVSRQIL